MHHPETPVGTKSSSRKCSTLSTSFWKACVCALILLGCPLADTAANAAVKNLVSGHFAPTDGFQHAMALVDGTLNEIFFDPTRGLFRTPIAHFDKAVSVASFAADNGSQHTVVATSDLRIFDVWWDSNDIHERVIANFRSTRFVQVVAFYATSERRKHVVTATDTGEIEDLSWDRPDDVVAMRVIGKVGGIVGIAGLHNEDDHFNVVQVLSIDGGLREIFYKDPAHPSTPNLLTTFSDVAGLAGFFFPEDTFRHAIVLSRTGLITDYQYHPLHQPLRRDLTTIGNAVGIGSYATPDGFRHVIVAIDNGDVDEVFYRQGEAVGQGLLARLHAPGLRLEDASPEQSGGTVADASIGGRATAVAGTAERMYALSPNAGVWRSDNRAPFVQLFGSPRYGAVIAVDPKDTNHLVVGERNGDASPQFLSQTGVWESTDAGGLWTYVYNPRALSGCANDAAVSSVLFSRDGSIFVATPCGVVRRKSGAKQFSAVSLPQVAFTALAVSDRFNGTKRVWARTPTAFYVSNTDGDTWTSIPSPPPVGGEI
jgi:hypothetical protein